MIGTISEAIRQKQIILDLNKIVYENIAEILITNGKNVISSIQSNGNIFENFENLKILDLQYLSINQIPKGLFKNLRIETLNLRLNRIKVIEEDSFCDLTYLKSLKLSDNLINKIDSSAFDKLIQLEELNLSNNKLDSINGCLFKCLKNLKILNLSMNNILELNRSDLYGLNNLEQLIMEHVDCKYAEDSISYLNNLKIFKLSYSFTKFSLNQAKLIGPKFLKELYYEYRFGRSPHMTWISQHENLTVLSLNMSETKLNSFYLVDIET